MGVSAYNRLCREHRLTQPQVSALRAFGTAGEIARVRAGYNSGASYIIPPRTVVALAGKGYVEINAMRGCCGTARITTLGRSVLVDLERGASS